jgi:hypothetical protein
MIAQITARRGMRHPLERVMDKSRHHEAVSGAVGSDETWNTPEAIERHRAMTPEERIHLMVKVSNAAMKFAAAKPANDR